ncbi:DUF6986 family protein [Leucobacter albus]|uniref:DUF6986 family protein n=1 Tax=Leucobacter albus TaxID=272210 RepID=A0ABW3TPS1_9MICO
MTEPYATTFTEREFATAAEWLAPTDLLLETAYPGDDGSRQPIHTVYIPGQHYRAGIAQEWGERAAAYVAAAGGYAALGEALELPPAERAVVLDRVRDKLASEPIEDLRIDFEDGFGDQGDEAEDAAVVAAARALVADLAAGTAPPYVGIRFKCFEVATRERGMRTLDLFLTTLVGELGPEGLPEGLILTLPKVSTVEQVHVMVMLVERLELELGLAPGRLTFEVQIETPQVIIAADGTFPIARFLHRGAGRISGLHYGTYDYSASVGVSAAQQSLEHPAADFAKEVMQVAVAGTGVRLSDGSTNVIPASEGASAVPTWQLHGRLVTRSLERAYYQGWDLHPAHLPSRFAASYAFFRTGVAEVSTRLRNYVQQNTEGFLDEPATARPLAAFLARGLQSGAVTAAELSDNVGISQEQLLEIAYPQRGRAAAPHTNEGAEGR